MSLWDYLKREVSYGYLLRGREDIYSEKQQRILTIMRTPRELEKVNTILLCSLRILRSSLTGQPLHSKRKGLVYILL